MKESNSCPREIRVDYTHAGDYLIPNLTVPSHRPITGKTARRYYNHLREHHPILFNHLLLNGKLFDHVAQTAETAERRMEILMPQMMASAGVTEELKAADPLRWAGLMNTLKAQTEEIILSELIYTEEQEAHP